MEIIKFMGESERVFSDLTIGGDLISGEFEHNYISKISLQKTKSVNVTILSVVIKKLLTTTIITRFKII